MNENTGYENMEIDGGSEFLKCISGGVINFNILSQSPVKQKIHWDNRQKIACQGVGCQLCSSGNVPKQRWLIWVFDRSDKKPKKFEFGATIASQIKGIAEMLKEADKTIHDTDIRIKATGSGIETEYQVLHVPITGLIPPEIIDQYRLPF